MTQKTEWTAGPPTASKRALTLRKLKALEAGTPFAPEAQAARDKLEQLRVHQVIVQVAPATDGGNPGEVAYGYYVIEDGDTLVMTDSEGAPIKHHAIEGRVKLLPSQNAETLARILTRRIHRAGEGPHAGFYRRLQYSNKGIV